MQSVPDKSSWITDPDYWDQLHAECEHQNNLKKKETWLETQGTSTLKAIIFHTYYGVVAAKLTIMMAKVSSLLPKGSSAASMMPSSACDIFKLLNLTVFVLWVRAQAKQGENSDFFRAMSNHFVAPLEMAERQKRPHSLLLSAFSHRHINQLIRTFMVLLVLGEKLEPTMGCRKFVYLYIYSIYASQFLEYRYVLKSQGNRQVKGKGGSLGASKAIRVLMAYYCLRRPEWILMREDVDAVVLFWFLSELFYAIIPGAKSALGLHEYPLGLGSYVFASIFWLTERLSFGADKP